MKYAARADSNQREIVGALRQMGATVESLHRVGRGVPDLLIGFRGHNYLAEVKTATGKPSRGQVEWMRDWRGQSCIIRSVEDAMQMLGLEARP